MISKLVFESSLVILPRLLLETASLNGRLVAKYVGIDVVSDVVPTATMTGTPLSLALLVDVMGVSTISVLPRDMLTTNGASLWRKLVLTKVVCSVVLATLFSAVVDVIAS